jgi:hypothetical protein
MHPIRARQPLILIVGDLVALSLFAPLGLLSHREGITLDGIARNAGPIAAGWLVAAAAFGVYRRGAPRRGAVGAWLAGVSGGVVLRAVVLRRPLDADEAVFWAVTLAVTGALLGAWRLVWARTRRAAGARA